MDNLFLWNFCRKAGNLSWGCWVCKQECHPWCFAAPNFTLILIFLDSNPRLSACQLEVTKDACWTFFSFSSWLNRFGVALAKSIWYWPSLLSSQRLTIAKSYPTKRFSEKLYWYFIGTLFQCLMTSSFAARLAIISHGAWLGLIKQFTFAQDTFLEYPFVSWCN